MDICDHRIGICNHHESIRNHQVGVNREFGLKGLLSVHVPNRSDRTHVKDVKDSNKFLFPSRNLLLVALREDESGHHISFTLLGDFLLDPCQSPAI